MRLVQLPVCGVVLFLAAGAVVADEHSNGDAGIFPPDTLDWRDGPGSLPPGSKLAVLEGDMAKDGPFVVRLKLPDGYTVPAHTHPKTERLTVISGTFNIIMLDKPDKELPRTMPAGSFGYWAAGMKHKVWAKGETVVQLHGMGPWSIKYVNPADDPRNKER
jgi:hypothetical protein